MRKTVVGAFTTLCVASQDQVSNNKYEQLLTEYHGLKVENLMLKQQIASIKQWLQSEAGLEGKLSHLREMTELETDEIPLRDFYRRRIAQMQQSLNMECFSLQAKVIFREPATWSSAVWIDLGEEDNQRVGRSIITENSPVVFGSSIVGVVEQVGPKKSRVRLITDANLVPSVRVARGDMQNQVLLEKIDSLCEQIDMRPDLLSEIAKENFEASVREMKKSLKQSVGDKLLAKGELHGCSSPLWRARGSLLRGTGFNYDFDDEEGSARELRTGVLLNDSKQDAEELVKVGDLLVTTGMDGVFPAGYGVAIVSKVMPLREGAYAYELEAKPVEGDLNELLYVQVLPAVIGAQ